MTLGWSGETLVEFGCRSRENSYWPSRVRPLVHIGQWKNRPSRTRLLSIVVAQMMMFWFSERPWIPWPIHEDARFPLLLRSKLVRVIDLFELVLG